MKAHYQIKQHQAIVYFFTTTTRNLEGCLNIINERFKELDFYKVFMNDKEVYEKKRLLYYGREVLDRLTGKVYRSIYFFHKETKVNYSTAKGWVRKKRARLTYVRSGKQDPAN